MLNSLNILLFILLSLCISSCSSTIESRIHAADKTASLNSFEKKLVKAGSFVLTTYQHITDPHKSYVFYIEGDGSIATGNYAIASNPTPSKIMLLKLATMDSRPNIVYLARPCQYTPVELNPKCRAEYWLDKRLSEEVIESINIAVNTISGSMPASLIGFSGGGGIAILVAARNHNIQGIVTIAGNLDIARFSSYHQVYALKESLNPIDYAKKITHIPQLHFSGDKDLIVPSTITNAYVEFSASPCVRSKIFPNITHTIGWDLVWKDAIKIDVTCKTTPYL